MPSMWRPAHRLLGGRRGQRDCLHRRERGDRFRILGHLVSSLSVLLLCTWIPGAGRAQGAGFSLARGWQHVLINAPGITEAHAQLVVGGPGLVAFAPGNPGKTGLWMSADGRAWHAVRLPTFEAGFVPWSFAAAGGLFLITGAVGGQHRIWASQDEGTTWHESDATLDLAALAAGGDGMLGFTRVDLPTQSSTVCTSRDGLTWRQLPQASRAFAHTSVLNVVSGGPGLAANVHILGDGAALLTSRDGRTWGRAPKSLFGITSFVNGLVAGPGGIVAAGELGAAHVLWASPDGVHWRREPAPFNHYGVFAAWQKGLVQLIGLAGTTTLWSSGDGLRWTREGSDELFGGTVRVTGAAAFKGGVVAIGSIATPPRPACLRTGAQSFSDLRSFHTAVLLWSPAASVSAAARAVDRSDPRSFTLLPSDLAAAQHPGPFVPTGSSSGAYVNLCATDPALGPHRAYSLRFFDRYSNDGHGNYTEGEALSIITQTPQAATAGFPLLNRLFGFGVGTIQRRRELPPDVRIGTATRLFQLTIRFDEPPSHLFTQFALEWRQGRAIGVVEAGTRQEAVMLAERQHSHLGHP